MEKTSRAIVRASAEAGSLRPRPGGALWLLLVFLLPLLGACGAGDSPGELPTTLTARDAPWPRQFDAGGTAVTIYQPQVESWHGYRRIRFRSAVSFTPDGAEDEVFGAIRVEADTDTDVENRSVLVGNMEITGSHFVGLDDEQSAEWTRALGGVLPAAPMPVELDRVLAYFEHTGAEAVAGELAGRAAASTADRGQIAHDAPRIFVSDRPAVLVMLDGEPVLFPIEGTGLMFAVNTNWDLFFDAQAGRYYLLDFIAPAEEGGEVGALWLTAARLDGQWTVADQLPPDFLKLPESEDWAEVRKHLQAPPAAEPPVVFTSTRPAELIVTAGAPALTPIEGTRLLWVQNTEADLFLHGVDGRYYYLVSGRWFAAKSLDGPWQLASDELPADFAAIPADHQKAGVLASVPGTAQAEEAVRLAQVPRTATVKRDEAKAEVAYQGDPEFESIDGTEMEYATNTQSDVIKVGDTYFLCLQGVWFTSASATGPWMVADKVADEIYEIPPSSPVHHVTYVEVHDSGPGWVTVGYTAAYLGLMIAIFDSDPVVVYGTGWYYPPYVHYGPRPVYYPYAHSYGAAAWYNPSTGTYGRGARVYGPYGGAGRGAAYNPRTGTYARGAAAWGPYGGSAAYQAYNPRTDTYRAGYRSANPYASRGEGVVERGDKWAHGAYYSDSRGTVAGVRTSEGDRALAARTSRGRTVVGSDGDVYAGRNGQVYKRSDGGWSRYDDGDWNSVDRPHASASQRAKVQNREVQNREVPNRASAQGQSSAGQRAAQNRAELQNRASASQAGSGLSASQRSQLQNRASQAGSGLSASQRASQNRSELQNRASQARSGLDASQRSQLQNRASQAGSGFDASQRSQLQSRAAGAGWDRGSTQGDVLRQLDADARARAQGSQRAEQYRGKGGQDRSRAGRSRGGGRRGRGG